MTPQLIPTELIPLTKRDGSICAFAIVDKDDYEYCIKFRWYMSQGYAARNIKLTNNKTATTYLHRDIFDLLPGNKIQVDHIYGNKLNNSRSNLRKVSHSQNQQNRIGNDKRNTSGYRGIWWDKSRQKWRAEATIEGKRNFIGYFIDLQEANKAAIKFRKFHMPYSSEARI